MDQKSKNVTPPARIGRYLRNTDWELATPLYLGTRYISAIVSRPSPDPMVRDWRLLTYRRADKKVTIGTRSSPLLTGAQAQLINHLANNGDSLKYTERMVLPHARTFPRIPVA